MALALASISGFVLRWVWLNSNSSLLEKKLTRILPHIIDTVFLATGIWLTITIAQYPFANGWLTAKVFGLVAYILLGSMAMRKEQDPRFRSIAFIAALLVFTWIASVARMKEASGFLGLLT
jgi:uncharacterized membrane protein SirB2